MRRDFEFKRSAQRVMFSSRAGRFELSCESFLVLGGSCAGQRRRGGDFMQEFEVIRVKGGTRAQRPV